MKTYRALAALLSYPDQALLDSLPELEALLPAQASPLLRELAAQDLLASQERYVALFDRSRALSLHLFEHVHGESRDRGQAMVDLQALYEQRGMRLVDNELPDYLPAFLEFLSLLPQEESRPLLGETAGILRALGERLAERASAYSGVLAALLELAGEPGLRKVAASSCAENAEQLDREWMDPQVTFGGPQPVRFHRKAVAA